jgi:micrococcal nuclease
MSRITNILSKPFDYFRYKKPQRIVSEDCVFDFSEVDDENKEITWEDTIPFTVPIKGGKVIKVYDGDSITIAAKLPFKNSLVYRFSIRLNGIDTPEIKGKTDDEKEAAKNARDALSNLILNKYITLKNVDNEKYGRVLADVYLENLHVNDWLVKERYAVRYDGGTKKTPSSWLNYKNNKSTTQNVI